MRKVAILEKTRTPYRPPLFNYVGQYIDLTVHYVGKTPPHRQWDTSHEQENYREVSYNGKDIGPVTVVPNLRDILVQEDYDEIIVASELNMLVNSYAGALAASELGANLKVWTEYISTPWINGEGRPFMTRAAKQAMKPTLARLQRGLYRRSDSIIAYSELAESAAVKSGADASKITLAPPWYPPEILSTPKRNHPNSSKYRVLFVGELCKRKGIETLIQTACTYDATDGIEFAIAGTGTLENLVADAANRNDHIYELGYIDGQVKATEFTTADLFVLPSLHDPWGQVVNEAYIFKTPVVITETAGAEMIVADELTVTPGDPQALRKAIERARQNPQEVPKQPSLEKMAKPLI